MKSFLAHAVLFWTAPVLAGVLDFIVIIPARLLPDVRQRMWVLERIAWLLVSQYQFWLLAAGAWTLHWFGIRPSAWFVVILLSFTMKNDWYRMSKAGPANFGWEASSAIGNIIGISVAGFYFYSF